jgi:hypothetical protein
VASQPLYATVLVVLQQMNMAWTSRFDVTLRSCTSNSVTSPPNSYALLLVHSLATLHLYCFQVEFHLAWGVPSGNLQRQLIDLYRLVTTTVTSAAFLTTGLPSPMPHNQPYHHHVCPIQNSSTRLSLPTS